MRRMQIGQIVDYCVAYNERNKEQKTPKRRRATQEEINAYFG